MVVYGVLELGMVPNLVLPFQSFVQVPTFMHPFHMVRTQSCNTYVSMPYPRRV